MIKQLLENTTPGHEWNPGDKEVKFHPVRLWRFDWACPSLMIAVEFHGAVHRQGRHTRGVGFLEDREKMREAQILGWIVLEYQTPRKLADMRPVLSDVQRIFEAKKEKRE